MEVTICGLQRRPHRAPACANGLHGTGDRTFPSILLFAAVEGRPLHAVAPYDSEQDWVFIITAYEPSPEKFEPDFKTRRSRP